MKRIIFILAVLAVFAFVNMWIIYEIRKAAEAELTYCRAELNIELNYKSPTATLGLPTDACDALRVLRNSKSRF